jgi:hypothetical protein
LILTDYFSFSQVTSKWPKNEQTFCAKTFATEVIASKLVKLERLIIDNIESEYLENLLTYLQPLPHLTSLVDISVDQIIKENVLLHLIFRLLVLKYCKVLSKDRYVL